MAGVQANNQGVPQIATADAISASALQTYLSDVSSAYGIFAGLEKGGTTGDVSAALNATSLAGKTGVLGTAAQPIGAVAGDLAEGLGLVGGIEQGGVLGDTTAAIDATKLASSIGGQTGLLSSGVAADLGGAASVAGAGLAIYNEINSWQSGATGSDALGGLEAGAAATAAVGVVGGLEAGASAGSVVGPIGTVIGGVIGAAVGALSSLIGGGKADPESLSLQNVTSQYNAAYNEDPAAAQQALTQLTPAQSFQLITGAFDAKNDTPGHSQPLEQALGRMGEGTFLTDMAGQINTAVTNGTITPTGGGGISVKTGGGTVTYSAADAPAQVYSMVVQPWINSITGGSGIEGGQDAEGGVLTGAVQNLIGSYMSGGLTSSTPIGVNGQAATTLPAFAGTISQAAQPTVAPAQHASIAPYTAAMLSYPGSGAAPSGSMLPVLMSMPVATGAASGNSGALYG